MKLAEEPGVYKIIEKDALRFLLDGGVWSKSNEKFVLRMRDTMIVATLEAGLPACSARKETFNARVFYIILRFARGTQPTRTDFPLGT